MEDRFSLSGLQESYEAIVKKVPNEVTLVAVSKKQSVEKIKALYRLGHRDFGENYVQELLEKAQQLSSGEWPGLRWHFIGHLQTNKVKSLVEVVWMIHSIDSLRLAKEVSRRMQELRAGERLPICIEVNLNQEATKAGVSESEVRELSLATSQLPGLDLQGLMCIPSAEKSAWAFERLRTLEQSCRPYTQGVLSMGMTHDFEAALKYGATHLRIGTAIFGERPSNLPIG